jgi:hypothetical protein
MDISEFSRLDDKGNYNRHPWETSRKNVLFSLLKKFCKEFPIERAVDIGSGDSYVIHTLLEKDFANEYFAIDTAYTPEVISQLKINNNNSKVNYLQSLNDYEDNFQTDKRTLFLCMDVLEHVEDEKTILDFLKPKLTNQNYYFFAVPAFQSIFSNHDVLLGHYRRYSLTQLNNLLIRNQFIIVDKGYYFTILLFLRKIDKLFKKDKAASIDNWAEGKLKTYLMNAILTIDFKISNSLNKTGITIPGLSCYCLCKK